MIPEHDDVAPLVLLANFASPVSASLDASEAVRGWSEQAPRKVWLTRPGDVLVSPVPIPEDFRRYAGGLLGFPHETVEVVVVPDLPGTGMPEAVRRHGLGGTLQDLARRHPGTRLLPGLMTGEATSLPSLPCTPPTLRARVTAAVPVLVKDTCTVVRSDASCGQL